MPAADSPDIIALGPGPDERARRLLDAFQPESGIRVVYSEGMYGVDPPEPQVPAVTDEELMDWAYEQYGVTTADFAGPHGAEYMRDARQHKSHEWIGGLGITDRDMAETLAACPRLEAALGDRPQKVVVLGAGFSELPVTLANMYAAGEIGEVPVVDDLMDYSAVRRDFATLEHMYADAGLEFPFQEYAERVAAIDDAAARGHLRILNYMIGSGSPPPELLDADIAVNIAGPNLRSLHEQISLLAPGGTWLSSYGSQRDLPVMLPGYEFASDMRPGSRDPLAIKRQVEP